MSRIGAMPRAAVCAPGAPERAAASPSNARAEASRKNGARSRGPKTPEGRARSARNALKHGMRAARHVVLPDEDAAEFAALEAALLAELAPAGVLQTLLARRIAAAAWRLARADRMEAEVLGFRSDDGANAGLALIRDGNATRSFDTLMRYRGAAMAEFTRALRTLKALQAEAAAPVERTAGVLALERRGSGAIARAPGAPRSDPNQPGSRGAPCATTGWGTNEPEPPRTLQEPRAPWAPDEPEPLRAVQDAAQATGAGAGTRGTSHEPPGFARRRVSARQTNPSALTP